MDIQFKGKFDKQTFYKAVGLVSKPDTRSAIFRIGLSLLITAIFTAYSILLFTKEEQSTFELAKVTRHFITLPFFLYYLLKPFLSAVTTARQLWQHPATQSVQSGTISSLGICFDSAPSESLIRWDKIAKIRQTENLLALLTDDGILVAFARNFFSSGNDWLTVQKWASQKILEAK